MYKSPAGSMGLTVVTDSWECLGAVKLLLLFSGVVLIYYCVLIADNNFDTLNKSLIEVISV